MEDGILIRAYRSGDVSSFSQIYEKYIDDIYRYVFRKIGDIPTSEDVTSQIWIKIFNNISLYEEQSGASFKSWIYRIAHNSIVDYYRGCKDVVDIEDISEPSFHEDFAKTFDDKKKLEEVQLFLKTLSVREQEIVFFRVWDDLSYKEISEILDVSVDNCKQIYSRSIKKIQANIMQVLILICIML